MAALLLKRLSTRASPALNAFRESNRSRRFPFGAAAAVSGGLAVYYCYSSPTVAQLDAEGEQTVGRIGKGPRAQAP